MFKNLRNKLAVLALVAVGLAFGNAWSSQASKTKGELIYEAIINDQLPDGDGVWEIPQAGEQKEQKGEIALKLMPAWQIIVPLNNKNVELIKTKITTMIQQQDVIDHIIVHNIASSHIVFKGNTNENSPELIVVSDLGMYDGYLFTEDALNLLNRTVNDILNSKSPNIEEVMKNNAISRGCSKLKQDIRNFLNGNPLSIKGCAFFRDQTFTSDSVEGLKYRLKHYAAGKLFAELNENARENLRKRLKEQICAFLSGYKITVNTNDNGALSLSSTGKNGMLKLVLSIADDNSIYISHFGLSSSNR